MASKDQFNKLNDMTKTFEQLGLLGAPKKVVRESKEPSRAKVILEDIRTIIQGKKSQASLAEQVLSKMARICTNLTKRDKLSESEREAFAALDDEVALMSRRISRGGLDESSMESKIQALATKMVEAIEECLPKLDIQEKRAGKLEDDDDDKKSKRDAEMK